MGTQSYAGRAAVPSLIAVSLLGAALADAQPAADEVVVTGVPHDRAPGEIAQAVTVLQGDTLDRLRAANLGEALSSQLGVSSSYFGAGASRPIIRGLAGARVQTLEDGIESFDAATVSDDHAVTVEPLAADQIEIFRGPTTLLYGSGAVGGVINTVTTRIPMMAPADGFEGAVEVRGDSVADGRAAAVRLDGGGAKFAWHLDAGHRDSDDYEIPGFAHADAEPGDTYGVVENSAAESDASAFGASWLGDNAFLGVGLSFFDTLYGIPGHGHEHEEGEEEHAEEAVRIDLEQRRLDLKGGWMALDGPIEAVSLRLARSDYEHVELEGTEVGTRFTNDATELRLELLHAPWGRWTGAFGLQLADREFAAVGEEAFVPPVDTQMLGVFLVEDLELDRWHVSLGGRIEMQKQTPSNGLSQVDDSATSLSAGGIRTFDDGYSLALSLALAERLPVAEELYSDGPHLATGLVQIGDASLRAETSQHFDVSLRREVDDLRWSLTGFVTRYDDFIYLADTGAVDAVDELPIFAFAQQDADFTGIEAELFVPVAEPGPGEIDLRLFADYVRGELANGESLPRLPPLRYGARLQYHDERLLVGFEATRYDEQDEVAAFEEPTAGYTLVNADFRWRVATAAGAELEVFATASNLGNEEARKHTSFVKDVAPLPGRNYAIGVRSRF